jgi:hypothetical protein
LLTLSQDLNKVGMKESLYQSISNIYPDYEWLPWKFQQNLPIGFWKDPVNQKKFVDWAATQFQIKDMSDWYKITQHVKTAGKIWFLIFRIL